MKSFKLFLAESVQEEVPHQRVADFIQHLFSPSEKVPKKGYLNEELSEELLTEISVYDVHKNLPQTSAMIKQGEAELPKENLHKRIHSGFRSTHESMKTEDPKTQQSKLKESRAIFDSFAKSRGYKKAPKLLGENGKTKKSSGEGVHTKGLALAPHALNGLSGFDVCPRASSECKANCLGTTAGGNKQYPDFALRSKVLRTHFLAAHPEHFARILHNEVSNHEKSATKKGMIPGVRLNVTSDISWEHHAPELMNDHPKTQFYDYTKMPNRVMGQNKGDHPKNYHLTLSHTGTDHAESNDEHAIKALEAGHVVAMVHQKLKKGQSAPTHVEDVKTGKRYPIVNGDKDDNTFDRKTTAGVSGGVVSGLHLKGVKNEQAGHFANKVDSDGVIRINK